MAKQTEKRTDQMMKILVVINHSHMLWQMRKELIRRLLDFGEVVICTPFVGHEHDFEDMGCHCIEAVFDRHGTDPFQELKLIAYYKRIIEQVKPDLVITYSIKPNVYAGTICRMKGIPYCSNITGLGTAFRNKAISPLVTMMYRTAVRGAKAVFFENESNARLFRERNIIHPDRLIRMAGAGVNLQEYSLQPYPDESKGIHFLYLGRIMRDKGVGEFLDVAEKLKAEMGDKVVFDVAGFYDGEGLRERVTRLTEQGVIVFHGFQNDPRPCYNAAHCVILPSYHEGMSNVLLEAAATGRALITSDIPGCREAVEYGVTGYLVIPEDTDSLYNAVVRFLSLTLEQRENMGLQGRKLVEDRFDRDDVVESTLQAFGLTKNGHTK